MGHFVTLIEVGLHIMYSWTEFGRARRENIWPEVMAYGPSAVKSVRHDKIDHNPALSCSKGG